MTKIEVITKLAQENVVEEIISNISKKDDDFYNDLSQDIYISLMEKNESELVQMYEKDQIRFYITRMVLNNIFSKNSPFWCKYKKFSVLSTEITRDIYDEQQYRNR